jgi:hypothetical protein
MQYFHISIPYDPGTNTLGRYPKNSAASKDSRKEAIPSKIASQIICSLELAPAMSSLYICSWELVKASRRISRAFRRGRGRQPIAIRFLPVSTLTSEEVINPPWALATARIRLCETFNPCACRCQQQHTKPKKPPHVN